VSLLGGLDEVREFFRAAASYKIARTQYDECRERLPKTSYRFLFLSTNSTTRLFASSVFEELFADSYRP